MRRGGRTRRTPRRTAASDVQPSVTAAFAFYLFAGIVVLSGALTILSRNPVHSVLWLICAFFNAAGLFILLGAEFLAMLLVIVYVGAVAVLFLFVVMMLDVDFAALRAGFVKALPVGVLLAVVLVSELVFVAGSTSLHVVPGTAAAAPFAGFAGMTNTQALGSVLYTRYLFVFQAAGMVLLTAMVGAIVLTHRQRPGTKRQDISRQVQRTAANAVAHVQPVSGEGVTL